MFIRHIHRQVLQRSGHTRELAIPKTSRDPGIPGSRRLLVTWLFAGPGYTRGIPKKPPRGSRRHRCKNQMFASRGNMIHRLLADQFTCADRNFTKTEVHTQTDAHTHTHLFARISSNRLRGAVLRRQRLKAGRAARRVAAGPGRIAEWSGEAWEERRPGGGHGERPRAEGANASTDAQV